MIGDSGGRVPVTLLTGFLGSGKTTLLRHLLRQPLLAKAAVVINELGEAALDDALLVGAGVAATTLAGGCVCCTVRGDLTRALGDLFVRRARGTIAYFDRLLIETTGLADPVPILQALMTDPLLAARYRLDGVVTTVDAVRGLAQLAGEVESLRQAALADRIVLTKTDLAGAADIAALRLRLAALNPAAPILTAVGGAIEPASLFGAGLFDAARKTDAVRAWLNAEAYAPADHDHDHDHAHDPRIRAFALEHGGPVKWTALLDWLDALTALAGERLLRLKGIVAVAGRERPVAIHAIGALFHPPAELARWPDGDRRTRIVVIARDLPPAAVADSFRAFVGAEEAQAAEGGRSS